MAKVDLIYVDAGAGHRVTAEAIHAVLSARPSWQVRRVSLQEILRPLDWFGNHTGFSVEDLYNLMLQKNWTWAASPLLPLMHFVIRSTHHRQVELISRFWKDQAPDLAVSVAPHFNRAIREGLRCAAPHVPFAVAITDFADAPPHFWIEPQDQSIICGSDKAVGQARAAGVPTGDIYRTSGMILHPRYYQLVCSGLTDGRERLGLDPAMPTGIVSFGGQGSNAILRIVEQLERSRLNLQLILLCGRNEGLAARLRRQPGRLRRTVVGFTTDMPEYLGLADFFIGKPGPASIMEALRMGLPVILQSGIGTMPQERYNAEWVLEQRVGIVISSFRKITPAVEEMLSPGQLSQFRANAAALNNRALFEVPEIFERILLKSRMEPAKVPSR